MVEENMDPRNSKVIWNQKGLSMKKQMPTHCRKMAWQKG
jgi:hypothetical protein